MKILILTFLILALNQPAYANDKKASDFFLKDIFGKTISLSDYKGKVVLLHFWAMWCGDCLKEIPSLNNAYVLFKDKGLEVVSISTDTSISKLQEFSHKNKIEFVILHDPDKSVTIKSYQVIGLPVTFIIDRGGKIIERINGPRDWNSQTMKKKIHSIVQKKQ